MPDTTEQRDRAESWVVPITCVVIGIAYLLVGVLRDEAASGVVGLAIMLAYGAGLVLFRRRSEAVALLNGEATDERRAAIMSRARDTTAQVLVLVLVAGMFWSLATDKDYAGVFIALAAIGGLTFIASTIWHARRG